MALHSALHSFLSPGVSAESLRSIPLLETQGHRVGEGAPLASPNPEELVPSANRRKEQFLF